MGKITLNTEQAQRRSAQKNLEGAKLEQVLARLDEIIALMDASPTVAQRTDAVKDLARMMKHLINHIRK